MSDYAAGPPDRSCHACVRGSLELSALVLVPRPSESLHLLIAALRDLLRTLAHSYEIVVVKRPGDQNLAEVAALRDVRVIQPPDGAYGALLEAGLQAAGGSWILTLDADMSHDLSFVQALWAGRCDADVLVASRYVDGGGTDAPCTRRGRSRLANRVLGWVLNIDVTDLSSGFRLYRCDVVQPMVLQSRDLSALVEALVRAYAGGWRIKEVPFRTLERSTPLYGSGAPVPPASLLTAYRMWKLRNSIACADYDARAYASRIPFQRYWQHRRCDIAARLAQGGGKTLDVGCGSSRTLCTLRTSVVGVDIQLNKLRYARRYGVPLVQGDIFHLPFASGSFDCVVSSQVIEHLPDSDIPFEEMARVLRPGGRLVLGTPDYGTRTWRVIERLYGVVAPGAYADQHITHYSRASLFAQIERHGFTTEATEYILGAELIVQARKESAKQKPRRVMDSSKEAAMARPGERAIHNTIRVENLSRSQDLVCAGRVANNFWASLRGLIGHKPLAAGEGLILVPCNSIHTHFMGFPIDVIYADRAQKVVALDRDMKPWRFGRIHHRARFVIELPAGTIATTGTEVGDQLQVHGTSV